MKNCEICTHVNNKDDSLLITEHWAVALAPDQGYLGRCYVTLREHKASLSDLSDQEWAEYRDIVRRLERASYEAFGGTPFNWACMMNNAYQEADAQPHVHWHFRPRYSQPVTVNGIEFTDPQFGYHYDRDQRRKVDESTFREIFNRLQAALNA